MTGAKLFLMRFKMQPLGKSPTELRLLGLKAVVPLMQSEGSRDILPAWLSSKFYSSVRSNILVSHLICSLCIALQVACLRQGTQLMTDRSECRLRLL
jgi:hypothetical protein